MRTMRTTVVLAGLAGFVAAMPLCAAATQYEVVSVTDGGTVAGKVTWEGERPAVAPLPINKNPEVCDPQGKGDRPSPRLIIGAAGGVKNAVVSIDGVTKGKALPKGPFVLNQHVCEFDPHIMVVPRKAEVLLKSSDAILHNVHMFGAATYNIPFPQPVSLGKKMRKVGLVRLQCDAGHGWMSAYIHVTNHPYYAITAADGSFEISDVPAGKYTLRAWHEHWQVTGTTEKEGQVATYTFAEPVTQSQPVEVRAGEVVRADFEMSATP